jgi:putative iron-dependent peroxidase
MTTPQPAILSPLSPHARYLAFNARARANVKSALQRLVASSLEETVVIGLGPGLVAGLGASIDDLRPFPAISGVGIEVPSSQSDLWVWISGADRGEIAKTGNAITATLAPDFSRVELTDGFMHDGGRDLTGYEDGTENPDGEDAVAAAIVQGAGPGLDGASFVAVQRWVHDLAHFASHSEAERDDMIGRRIADNEEFDDAPASAHVKRSAQESFEPEAFMLRRSLPFTGADGDGLMFVAFGKSPDAFEAVLRRMVGEEDGITDALFRFSRPVTGGYYWCPPLAGGRLDLSALGL